MRAWAAATRFTCGVYVVCGSARALLVRRPLYTFITGGASPPRVLAVAAPMRAPDGTEFTDRAEYRKYVFLTQYTFKDR